jgi:hypothetical protein
MNRSRLPTPGYIAVPWGGPSCCPLRFAAGKGRWRSIAQRGRWCPCRLPLRRGSGQNLWALSTDHSFVGGMRGARGANATWPLARLTIRKDEGLLVAIRGSRGCRASARCAIDGPRSLEPRPSAVVWWAQKGSGSWAAVGRLSCSGPASQMMCLMPSRSTALSSAEESRHRPSGGVPSSLVTPGPSGRCSAWATSTRRTDHQAPRETDHHRRPTSSSRTSLGGQGSFAHGRMVQDSVSRRAGGIA